MKQQWRIGLAGAMVLAGLTSAGMAADAAKASWTDTVKVKGDLRYRYEAIRDDAKTDSDGDEYTRERHRIRARLGVEAKPVETLKLGMEISTGSDDPVSGNQTLGDGFTKKSFELSKAYADFALIDEEAGALNAIAGKMKNPFITMTEDLVWDSDANPEGLALQGEIGNDLGSLLANGGYLWVQERSSADDLMLYAGQLAAKVNLPQDAALTVGGAVYAFQDIQGEDVVDWEDENNSFGNRTIDGSVSGDTTNRAYASEFTPVVLFAKLDLDVAGLPVCLFGQSLQNVDADDQDQGFMGGLKLGKADNKKPGSWQVGYSYAELEQDATVGFLTDSDRWGGGTDGNGHRIQGKYQVMKNVQLGATFLSGEKDIASDSTDYNRFQLDLAVKF